MPPTNGQWARDLALIYEKIAETSKYPLAKELNEAEARKYHAIADRMDRNKTKEVLT